MYSFKSIVHRAAATAGIVGAAAFAAPAFAAYPERPITLVVPFAAGGTTDLATRLVADLPQRTSGATVLIENKAGAGGMLGIQYVAKANPDGYTILYGSDSLIVQPLVNKAVTVGRDDFTPLVRVRTTGNCLAVGGAVPANNVRERVALAKSKPGQLRYATGGTGSVLHLAGVAFAGTAGLSLIHVPYRGAAPATADAVGDHVEMVWARQQRLGALCQRRPAQSAGAKRYQTLARPARRTDLYRVGLSRRCCSQLERPAGAARHTA